MQALRRGTGGHASRQLARHAPPSPIPFPHGRSAPAAIFRRD
jgi:hypothetical protein